MPTVRGWLLVVVTAVVLVMIAIRTAHPFLAVNDPIPGGALVVEGWAPDYVLAAAMAEFGRHPYTKLYVTGGPLEVGTYLSDYRSFGELGAATLIRMGLNKDLVQAVPAPLVRQDRTYTSAVALRNWFRQQHTMPASVNVITLGAHARRSRLLYAKAFGHASTIGIIAIETRIYDSHRWWQSSLGARTVAEELFAYSYNCLFFHPPKDSP